MSGKPSYPTEGAVALQWDPSITAFSSADRIRSLVAATSQDDVQVTAVVSFIVLFRPSWRTAYSLLAIFRLFGAYLCLNFFLTSDASQYD